MSPTDLCNSQQLETGPDPSSGSAHGDVSCAHFVFSYSNRKISFAQSLHKKKQEIVREQCILTLPLQHIVNTIRHPVNQLHLIVCKYALNFHLMSGLLLLHVSIVCKSRNVIYSYGKACKSTKYGCPADLRMVGCKQRLVCLSYSII